MTRETDALFEDGFGGKSSAQPEVLSPDDGPRDAMMSPGELERQHHALLERQGSGVSDAELVEAAREFVEHARSVGATQEDPRVRQHCQSVLDYWGLFIYRADRIEVDSDLLPFDPDLAPSLADEQFPYGFEKGADDRAQQMLGWRRLLDECEKDLVGDHLLTVMGEAGAGVRFLVHELLLPILQKGNARRKELAGSDQWRYYEIGLGDEPLTDILQTIAHQDGCEAGWVAQQEEMLRHGQTTLGRILDSAPHPAILIFNRFGTLLKAPPDDRSLITDNLANLLQDPQQRYYAIATLHRDQTIALSQFGRLEKPLRDGHVLMAFTTGELRHLIEEPARRVGLIFEPGLIDQILIDIQGEPTALRLLRFTLARLWNRRERNRITWQAYERSGAGREALRRAMDEIYQELNPTQQAMLRRVLLAMVNLEPDGSFAASEVPRTDLERLCGDVGQLDVVLGKLEGQELVRRRPTKQDVMFSLAYNALLTTWPPLISWLDELRVRERFRLRLRQAATLWNDRGKSADLLWQGAMLVEATEEFDGDPSLTTDEQLFLQASQRREAARRRKRQWIQSGIAFATIVALLGLLFGYREAAKAAEAEMRAMRVKRDAEYQAAKAENRAMREKQDAETRERLFGKAMEGVVSGDLPGTLLWLNERNDYPGATSSARPEAEEKISQIAHYQLPAMQTLGIVNGEGVAYENMAVSPDQRHLAVIRRAREGQSEEPRNNFSVTIFPLASPQKRPHVLTESDWKGGGNSRGSVEFVTLGSETGEATQEYCLAAAEGLRAWKQQDGTWKKVPVQPLPEADVPITELATGGDSLVLTVQQDKQPQIRRVQLWRLRADPDGEGLRLEKLLNMHELKELENRRIQVARISNAGHILALCSNGAEKASQLMVWARSEESEDRWELASPPEWVQGLAKNPAKRQRLHDWGWDLTDDGNWQRLDTFVLAAAFSQSGTQFATACDDGQVLVWNLDESPTDDGPATIATPRFETELMLGSSVFDVTFLDEDVILTGGRDRSIRIWDIHAAAEIAPRTYHEGTVNEVAFAGPDMVIANTRRMLRVWRSDAYEAIRSPIMVEQIARSEGAGHVVYVQSDAEKDALASQLEAKLLTDKNIQSAVVSQDGKWVFTATQASGESESSPQSEMSSEPEVSLELRRWTDFNRPQSLALPADFQGTPLAAFSPSGDRLVLAERSRSGAAPRLFSWSIEPATQEIRTGHRPVELPVANEAAAESLTIGKIAFTRVRGTDLLVLAGKRASESVQPVGVVFVAVPETEKNHTSLKVCRLTTDAAGRAKEDSPHKEEVLCVAFSDDGQLLATGDAHDRVKVWRVEDLLEKSLLATDDTIVAEPYDVLPHSSDVVNVAFAPNQQTRRLASVSSEGEAAVWSIMKNRGDEGPDYKLQHEAKILTVSFSDDGKWVLTGGADRAARIWDSRGGVLVGIFRHQGPVVQAWMPTDDQVLTISKSSRRGPSGEEPLLYVRHWQLASRAAEPLSEDELRERAARKIVNMRVEVLQASEFALQKPSSNAL